MRNGKNSNNGIGRNRLRRYLDKEGRVKIWPAKWKNRRMIAG